ncbi:MCE family protein [Amycolatopsis anabasis]|uniref:MCE family protein n=1 Tax=Amycolatopsis anabasis TaxID=1840409 RepID=UPI00131CFB8B|nr:MCE family protein [Amycolatopsis anabasis]
MSKSGRGARFGTQLAGVAFLVILALLVWFTVAIYDKRFTPTAMVTLKTDRVGNQLEPSSEVKVRGVPFGEVRAVRSSGDGAEIDLAMDPARIGELPSNVSARLLPKTAFGQRYVNLVLPDQPDTRKLAAGDVIPQDRSRNAIELERVLGDLLPLLRAVQPQKLNSSLGAIAQALDTRGKPLGDSIVKLNDLLAQTNPLMPQFKADITGLADVSDVYAAAAPDILRALADLAVPAKTVVDQKENLQALFSSVTTASGDLNDFLRKNKDSIIGLSESSRPTLELLSRYSPEFPCLFDAVNRMKPLMEKALGKGTGEPGLHLELSVQQPRGKYVPGKDDPVYNASGGPRCPGQGVSGGGAAAGSPEEHQVVSEILGAVMGTSPSEVPSWSSLLVGPLLRGTEVTLK